jgi:hypothetical protein
MIPYQWTTAGLGILLSLFIIYLVRKDVMHTKYSLWWLAISVCVVVLGIFPRLSDRLAVLFGVSYPPSLIFIASAGYILVKMLTMDIDRSRMEIQIRRLTQRMAILEEMIEGLKRDEQPPL